MLQSRRQTPDRLGPQAEWRLVHRVADAALSRVQRVLARRLAAPRDGTIWDLVVERLQRGDFDGAVYAIDLEGQARALVQEVWPQIWATYERTGQVLARRWPEPAVVEKALRKPKRKPSPATGAAAGAAAGATLGVGAKVYATATLPSGQKARVLGAFNVTNPRATQWAATHSARLVTNITTETRQAVRRVIADAFADQITVQDTAKRLRSIVGLTEPQARRIYRLGGELQRQGLAPKTIESRVTFQVAKALRDRAETIARTEIMAASNAGQQEAWLQAQERGLLPRTGLVKEWIVTPDDRLCDRCAAMDGAHAPIGGQFKTDEGEMIDGPPLHPNCRCARGLVEA